jgi:hypothetical protein
MTAKSRFTFAGFALIILTLHFRSEAQENRITDRNGIAWGNIFATIGTGTKTSVHSEIQFRRLLPGVAPMQLLIRVGLNYKPDANHMIHVGYGFIETYPYGDYPIAAYDMSFPEHRTYEQFNSNQKLGKLSMQHRFRLEQRWLGKRNAMAPHQLEKWTYLNRARYQIKVEHPLFTLNRRTFYGGGFNEVFIGFGRNIGANIFDQNRSCLLAGYNLNRNLTLEAGYFLQILTQGARVNNSIVIQKNSGLQVSLFLKS